MAKARIDGRLTAIGGMALCALIVSVFHAPVSHANGSSAQPWECIPDHAPGDPGITGQWEIQVDGDFSEFVYSRDLYPGSDPLRVAFTHVRIVRGKAQVSLASDQVDLVIQPGVVANGVCPVYGEKCERANLLKLNLPDVGADTTGELIQAPWACTRKAPPH